MDRIHRFHDGHLTGIRLWDDAATVYLRQEDGVDYELKLSGVEALHVEDFRQGNIILFVEIGSGSALKKEEIDLERLYPSPCPSTALQYHERYQAFVKKQIARIENGEACLVVIASSYGADLLAICREARFQRV